MANNTGSFTKQNRGKACNRTEPHQYAYLQDFYVASFKTVPGVIIQDQKEKLLTVAIMYPNRIQKGTLLWFKHLFISVTVIYSGFTALVGGQTNIL